MKNLLKFKSVYSELGSAQSRSVHVVSLGSVCACLCSVFVFLCAYQLSHGNFILSRAGLALSPALSPAFITCSMLHAIEKSWGRLVNEARAGPIIQ